MYSKQYIRQRDTPRYAGRRELDRTLFIDEENELSAGQMADYDRWLPWESIGGLQGRLQRGELTSRKLVLYFCRRIQHYAAFNAVGELNPDALRLADALDAERRTSGARGPLHGIPILLKDNIATGDEMHTTAGAKVLEHSKPGADASVARRLRAAGAILLGKTNMSEWANFMTRTSANGFSALGGQVRNPYGRFDVSGSSSGSAAAVAAGLAPAAVGTETCGSLISPGSANSAAVLKPSLGLVSRHLIIPITGVTDTAGPMARSVADLALLFQAMCGPDPEDAVTLAQAMPEVDWTSFLDAGALRGLRIGFVSVYKPGSAERAMIEGCCQVLRDCGAEVVQTRTRRAEVPWNDVLQVFGYGMQHDLAAYLQALPTPAAVSSLQEVIAYNQADLANRAPFGQDLLEWSHALQLSAAEHAVLADKVRAQTGNELRRIRSEGKFDLLASLEATLAGFYAIAGFPALTVPAGYRKAGAPWGLTFVGEPFEDGRLMAAAYAFEQAARVWIEPEPGRTEHEQRQQP